MLMELPLVQRVASKTGMLAVRQRHFTNNLKSRVIPGLLYGKKLPPALGHAWL